MLQVNKNVFLAFFAIRQPESLSGHISTDFVQQDCPRYMKQLFTNETYNSKCTSQDNHNRLSQAQGRFGLAERSMYILNGKISLFCTDVLILALLY